MLRLRPNVFRVFRRFMHEDLRKCFGCGASLHENAKDAAGYLPDMKNRQLAYSAGISYTFYKNNILKEHNISLQEYLNKKKLQIMPRLDELQIPAAALKGVSNSSAWKKDAEKQCVLEPVEPDRLICQRCFHLTFHKKVTDNDEMNRNAAQEAWLKVRDEIMTAKNPPLIVKVCDVLDFPGSVNLPFLQAVSERSPVILAVNKMDIIPVHANRERIAAYMGTIMDSRIMKNVHVKLMSALEQDGIDDLVNHIVSIRAPTQDIYVVGNTNVGKSTLLNSLIKTMKGPEKKLATASLVPGTTIDAIRIPLNKLTRIRDFVMDAKQHILAEKQKKFLEQIKKRNDVDLSKVPAAFLPTKSSIVSKTLAGYLVDTPGIKDPQSLTHHLTNIELKTAVPNARLKAEHCYLTPDRSIWVGGLGRLDYVEGDVHVIASVFRNTKVPLHFSSIANSEALWEKHAGGKSVNWEEKLLLKNGVNKVVRKNRNKDFWAGVKFVPPYFTSPDKYVEEYAAGGEILKDSGLLKERMNEYSQLELAFEMRVKNHRPLADHGHSVLHYQRSIVDFVFSGIGWISIAGNFDERKQRNALFRVWTPGGVGVYMRPSLLPFEVMSRGRKVKGQYHYKNATKEDAEKAKKAEDEWWKQQKKKLQKM